MAMDATELLEDERVLLHVIAKELERVGPPLEDSERSSLISTLRMVKSSLMDPPKTEPDKLARIVGLGMHTANVSYKPFTRRGVVNDVRPETMRKIKRLIHDIPYVKAAFGQCTLSELDVGYCESCYRAVVGDRKACVCGRAVCKTCVRGNWCEACMYLCESCGLTRSEPIGEKPRICSCGKRMCPECDIDGTCEKCTAN
jgi:hypothetical protein